MKIKRLSNFNLMTKLEKGATIILTQILHFRLPSPPPQLPWRTRRRASSRWRPPCLHPRGPAQSCGAHQLQSHPLRLRTAENRQQKNCTQSHRSHSKRLVPELRITGYLVCCCAGQLLTTRSSRLFR